MASLLRTVSYGIRALKAHVMHQPVLSQASLYITQRCNLRCLYCSSPYMNISELTTGQWQEVIIDLARLGCRRILLLGGEPLLRKDIGEIISAVKTERMRCVLTSNGLLVPRYIETLKMLDTLVLSMDAVGAANDKVRGKGVSAAVQKAIGLAREAGIPTKLNAVMTKESAPCLDELVRFVTDEDISLTINVVRSGNANLWHKARTVRQDDTVTRQLFEKLASLARDNPRILFSEHTYQFALTWPDYSCDRLELKDIDNDTLTAGPDCHAGRSYFSINADGSTHPCPLTADSIIGGNVVSDGVESGWLGLKNHDCKYCYTPCLVEQNYLYSLHLKVISQFARKHLPRYS